MIQRLGMRFQTPRVVCRTTSSKFAAVFTELTLAGSSTCSAIISFACTNVMTTNPPTETVPR